MGNVNTFLKAEDYKLLEEETGCKRLVCLLSLSCDTVLQSQRARLDVCILDLQTWTKEAKAIWSEI